MTDRAALLAEIKALRRGEGVTAAKLEKSPTLLLALGVTSGVEGLAALASALSGMGDSVAANALRNALGLGELRSRTLTSRRVAFGAVVERMPDAVTDYEDRGIEELAARLLPVPMSSPAEESLSALLKRLDNFPFPPDVIEGIVQGLLPPSFEEVQPQLLMGPLPAHHEAALAAHLQQQIDHLAGSLSGLGASKRKVNAGLQEMIPTMIVEARSHYAQGWMTALKQTRLILLALAGAMRTGEFESLVNASREIAAMAPYTWPLIAPPDGEPPDATGSES